MTTYEFKLGRPLIGFALNRAREGEPVGVQSRGFVSSEDGLKLISTLNEVSQVFRVPVNPAIVTQLIAVIFPDGRTAVWINSPLRVLVRPKATGKQFVPGDAVLVDDIADTAVLEFEGVDIPANCGYLALVPAGWWRGVVFDFGPLGPLGSPRAEDWRKQLATVFSYMLFHGRLSLTEELWSALLRRRWFPFVGLQETEIRELVRACDAGFEHTVVASNIAAGLRNRIGALASWFDRLPTFAAHRSVIAQAVQSFVEGNHPAVAALLYPRIEGILRDHFAATGAGSPSQKALIKASSEKTSASLSSSLLLPERFRQYLEAVVFAPEDFSDPKSVQLVTRHSASHGVLPEGNCNEETSAIALLSLEQLGYLFTDASSSG